jgi:hypothetical protein
MLSLPGAIWLFKFMDVGNLDVGDLLGTSSHVNFIFCDCVMFSAIFSNFILFFPFYLHDQPLVRYFLQQTRSAHCRFISDSHSIILYSLPL